MGPCPGPLFDFAVVCSRGPVLWYVSGMYWRSDEGYIPRAHVARRLLKRCLAVSTDFNEVLLSRSVMFRLLVSLCLLSLGSGLVLTDKAQPAAAAKEDSVALAAETETEDMSAEEKAQDAKDAQEDAKDMAEDEKEEPEKDVSDPAIPPPPPGLSADEKKEFEETMTDEPEGGDEEPEPPKSVIEEQEKKAAAEGSKDSDKPMEPDPKDVE